MANLRQASSSILAYIILPQILFVGCSVTGAVIAGVLSSNDPLSISFLTSGVVEVGTDLVVSQKDSATIRGAFLGLTTIDEVSYTERYLGAAGGLKNTEVLPLPGDSIVFAYAGAGGRPIGRGRFRGLDPGTLYLVRTRSLPYAETRIAMDSLRVLQVEGKGSVNLASIRSLISQQYLPTVTTHILLRNDADTTVSVPVGDIISVEVEGGRYGWVVGLGIGNAVDLAIIVALTTSW